jgi:hypothetical protein
MTSTLRAFAATVTPETAALSDTQWRGCEAVIEHALSRRPPRVRRQIKLLLRAIDVAARARYRRGFAQLDDARRTALIERLERAPVALIRRGIWGLRTLVFMGYYTGGDVAREIGYGATARGWLHNA